MSSPQSSTGRREGLRSWHVLLLGLLASSLCLALLLIPLGESSTAPWRPVQHLLIQLFGLIDSVAPRFLQRLLFIEFVPVLVLVVLLVLAVLPFLSARLRERAAARHGQAPGAAHRPDPRARTARRERPSALEFTEDGGITDPAHPGSWRIFRSVSELQEMARAAGIPWSADYESEGGARGLLEILRVLARDSAETVHEDDAAVEPLAEPLEPAPPVLRVDIASPSAAATPVGPGPEEFLAAASTAQADTYEPSAPSWTSSSSGAVYTSTTLYTSTRIDGRNSTVGADGSGGTGAAAGGAADDAADDAAGEVSGRTEEDR